MSAIPVRALFIRRVSWLLFVCSVSNCVSAVAQSPRSITIKMLNSQTGQTISTSEFQIWIGESVAEARTGRNPDQRVKPNKDGIGEATFKSGAEVITVHAQDRTTWGYVNCDAVKTFGWRGEQWYSITQIMESGIAAPNHCNRKKALAKPGEFVFFCAGAELLGEDARISPLKLVHYRQRGSLDSQVLSGDLAHLEISPSPTIREFRQVSPPSHP